MRFKATIQNNATFASKVEYRHTLNKRTRLTHQRAHSVAQLTRSAGMGKAQRRAGVLYHYPRTGHTGVGVS
jgi:hypothetical protein